MQHHNPHCNVKFEGYFSRFDLPSGATLAVVLCTVPNAPSPKRHNVSIRYIPAKWQRGIYQLDLWTKTFNLNPQTDGFTIAAAGQAVPGSQVIDRLSQIQGETTVNVNATSEKISYEIRNDDIGLHIKATSTSRVPWHYAPRVDRNSTPEGLLVNLPLPLHWHVQSLASSAKIELMLPVDANVANEDRSSTAIVHEEKNWAVGFPKAHVWGLGRRFAIEQGQRQLQGSICFAGGKIIGTEAFLMNYQNRELDMCVDFRPPMALMFLGWGPFMSFSRDFEKRRFSIDIAGWRYRLEIEAEAPKGSFFAFAAPWPEGFRENMMAESLRGTILVRLFRRKWWLLGWKELLTEKFEDCGVEFGGEYFPLADSESSRRVY